MKQINLVSRNLSKNGNSKNNNNNINNNIISNNRNLKKEGDSSNKYNIEPCNKKNESQKINISIK